MRHTTRAPAERGQSTSCLLVWLATFATAFGYIEAAVAHYLRMHLYPQGFGDSTLLVVDTHTLAVEIGRELCTLIVITAVAALTRPPLLRRVASFVYIFGIWDLSYYGALWLFEGWPSSVFDWDLLFLFPLPWFAPVLAPIAISAIGILGAVSVHLILDRRGELVVPWYGLTLVHVALIAWEISFMIHDSPPTRFPSHYRWWLFLLGVVSAGAGYVATWLKNASAGGGGGAGIVREWFGNSGRVLRKSKSDPRAVAGKDSVDTGDGRRFSPRRMRYSSCRTSHFPVSRQATSTPTFEGQSSPSGCS